MNRVLIFTLLFLSSLEARENPFFPSEGEKNLPYTSNQIQKLPYLKRASISLPSEARVIKKVTIEYENLDASIETRMIDLNHMVDWHLPVFISQSFTQETAETLSKVALRDSKTTKKKMNPYKNVGNISHAKFFVSKNNLKIITSDKLIRNFLLGQPHRIVMDFKKDSSLKTYIKKIPSSVFTKIRIGNHKGYYRVVIELDGYYRYRLIKQPDGCLITLQ